MYGIDSLWTEIGARGLNYGLVGIAVVTCAGALTCSLLYLYRLLRAVEHVAVRWVSRSADPLQYEEMVFQQGFEPEPLPFEPSGLPFDVSDAAMGGTRFAPFEADFTEASVTAEFDAEFDPEYVDAEFPFEDDTSAAMNNMHDADTSDVEQEVGIMRQGVLTINFVHMSQQFQTKAQESVIDPTMEQMAYSDEPVTKFRVREVEAEPVVQQSAPGEVPEEPAAGSFYLMEHMAVLSTQFDDLRRIVSVTEVSPKPGCSTTLIGEEDVEDKLRRLERIEEASIEMAAFSQAAGALGAQIDLLQHEYGSDDPELAPRYLRLAELHMALGKPEQAERCQLRALEVQGKAADSSTKPCVEIGDPLTDVEIQEFSTSMGSLGQHLRDLSPTDAERSEQARQHPPSP